MNNDCDFSLRPLFTNPHTVANENCPTFHLMQYPASFSFNYCYISVCRWIMVYGSPGMPSSRTWSLGVSSGATSVRSCPADGWRRWLELGESLDTPCWPLPLSLSSLPWLPESATLWWSSPGSYWGSCWYV